MTQSCLAGRVGIDVSTMTKALQRFERYGLVTRRPDEKDARLWRVSLSERGRALLPQIAAIWRGLEQRSTAGLSADECSVLSHLLGRVELTLS